MGSSLNYWREISKRTRWDSHPRPLAPRASALARLRYSSFWTPRRQRAQQAAPLRGSRILGAGLAPAKTWSTTTRLDDFSFRQGLVHRLGW